MPHLFQSTISRPWDEIVSNLQREWTPSQKDGPSPAVCTLLTLLRQVCAVMGEKTATDFWERRNQQNPIVDSAAMDLSAIDNEIKSKLTQMMPQDKSFAALCLEPSMKKLWATHYFLPIGKETVSGRQANASNKAEATREKQAWLKSHMQLVWDTSVHETLSDAIHDEERVARCHFVGQYATYTCETRVPSCFRVHFDPTKNPLGDEFGFEQLLTCEMMDGETTLSLIAVVRLRAEDEELDYIRIYDSNGHCIPPRSSNAAYYNREWSVLDQDHQYHLYYGTFAAESMAAVATCPREICDQPVAHAAFDGLVAAEYEIKHMESMGDIKFPDDKVTLEKRKR